MTSAFPRRTPPHINTTQHVSTTCNTRTMSAYRSPDGVLPIRPTR